MRLIYGKLCHSCYNRQLEALKGRDRRGKPVKFKIGIAVIYSDGKKFSGQVVTVDELVIDVIRKGNGKVISKPISGDNFELLDNTSCL